MNGALDLKAQMIYNTKFTGRGQKVELDAEYIDLCTFKNCNIHLRGDCAIRRATFENCYITATGRIKIVASEFENCTLKAYGYYCLALCNAPNKDVCLTIISLQEEA